MIFTEEVAIVVAKWWRKQLESPKFDNGAADYHSVVASVMASALAKKSGPTVEQLDVFESALRTLLLNANVDELECDYGPSELLATAYTAATGKSGEHAFPWKTRMQLCWKDKITVTEGYGAPMVPIWWSSDAKCSVCCAAPTTLCKTCNANLCPQCESKHTSVCEWCTDCKDGFVGTSGENGCKCDA